MSMSFQKEVKDFNQTLSMLYKEAFINFLKEERTLKIIKDKLPFICWLYNEKLKYNESHFKSFVFNCFREVMQLSQQSIHHVIDGINVFSIHRSLLIYFIEENYKNLNTQKELFKSLNDFFIKSKTLDAKEFYKKILDIKNKSDFDKFRIEAIKIQNDCLMNFFNIKIVKKALNNELLTNEEENELFGFVKSIYFDKEVIEDFCEIIKTKEILPEIKEFYKTQEKNRTSNLLTISFLDTLNDMLPYLKSFDYKLSKIFEEVQVKNDRIPNLKELLQKSIKDLIEEKEDFSFIRELINQQYNCNKREYYAGVGSRKIDENTEDFMAKFANVIENTSIVLRSGGAEGSDKAFEKGVEKKANKNIFYADDADLMSYFAAYLFHPSPYILSKNEYAKKLMARNTFQILGDLSSDVIEPSLFVVCWTKDGVETHKQRTKETGGTGQAISIADVFGIPVINVKNIL